MGQMWRVASAAQSSPGWGQGGGERRRRALRPQGPDRHRTGGWKGTHVRGDLCVVFGGGCVCHVDTSVPVCVRGVHDWMEWCVRADHMDVDVGVRLSGEAYVCALRVQRCVEKVVSQVIGLCLAWVHMGLCICQVGGGVGRSTQRVSLGMHCLPPPPPPHSAHTD